MEAMRLQKFLSRAGIASRRASEKLITAGRVSVNGVPCTELGTKVDPETDRVEVDGKTVQLPQNLAYVLVNKPRGYICSLDDPEGRPIVSELLPKRFPRVWPVGRLDWDSEGIILMTNDGDVTQAMTHPSKEIEKIYAVKVRGLIEPDHPELKMLKAGVDIGDPTPVAAVTVSVHAQTKNHTWLELVITEGRNRQIRRMCEALELDVLRLRRLAVGPLTLNRVPAGKHRELKPDEILALRRFLKLTLNDGAPEEKLGKDKRGSGQPKGKGKGKPPGKTGTRPRGKQTKKK